MAPIAVSAHASEHCDSLGRAHTPSSRAGDSAGSGPSTPPVEATYEPSDGRLADRTRRRLREAKSAGGAELRRAQAQVVADHLWLARSIAKRYRNRGEEQDDLFQVACVGLVEAVHRFDPDQGDFVAFAVPTISGLVKRHFRDHGWLIRPSRRTQDLVAGMRREWSDLAQELGQQPNDAQLAERLGENAAAVTEARCASQGYSSLSLDMLVAGNPQFGLFDGEGRDRVEARLVVEQAVRQLDAEERRLLFMRFYEGRSQSDIADEIGTSQMQISRRLARLLTRLRVIVGVEEAALLAS